jgi:hypothetical protein
MIVIRRKNFSGTKILNTNAPQLGFTRGRKYDTDLDRLGRMDTAQRELHRLGDLGREQRRLSSELNRGKIDIMND